MYKIVLSLAMVFIFNACEKPDFGIEKQDLLGEWSSSDQRINDQSLALHVQGGVLFSVYLMFRTEDFFALDYSSGSWSLEGNELNLDGVRSYRIVSYQENQIILESFITEGKIFRDLPGFENDEVFKFRETFTRSQ